MKGLAMRCPHCKTPIPENSINCPNCHRPLYDTTVVPNKTLRTEKISSFKPVSVSYLDSKTNIIWHTAGLVYKENADFMILLSSFSYSGNEDISWVKNAHYKVIPKKLIKERHELLGAKS